MGIRIGGLLPFNTKLNSGYYWRFNNFMVAMPFPMAFQCLCFVSRHSKGIAEA
jgi:hypothetical protein